MDLHKQTGGGQTPDLRITQATGALLIKVSQPLKELKSERITTYVERANGAEENLATNILLKHAIIAAVFGEGEVMQVTDGKKVFIETVVDLADGSILLGTDETIKCKLTELKNAVEYDIATLQYPESASSAVLFDKLTILNDETTRSFDVTSKDLLIIENADITRQTTFTYSNGHRIKFTPRELQAMSFDAEPRLGYDITTGTTIHDIGNTLVLPLMDVIEIEFQKVKGFQEITTVSY